jgi:hypothetical protein
MSRVTISAEQRAKLMAEFDELRSRCNALLDEHRDDLANLYSRVSAFFADATRGREFRRKPSLRLRVALPSGAHLVLEPKWVKPRARGLGSVDASTIRGEAVTVRRDRPWAPFSMTLTADGATSAGISRESPDYCRLVVAATQELCSNPLGVFARSTDHCCICGRALTDELSRCRGIGPECIKGLGFLTQAAGR